MGLVKISERVIWEICSQRKGKIVVKSITVGKGRNPGHVFPRKKKAVYKCDTRWWENLHRPFVS